MKKRTSVLLLSVALLPMIVSCGGRDVTSSSSGASIPVPPVSSSSSSTSEIDVDREAARVVEEMIEALNDSSTIEEIEAVVAAYNNLTERQKNFVSNRDKLAEYEEMIEYYRQVQIIISLIDALDENNPDEDAVSDVIVAYNALPPEWQEKVINSDKLERCEVKICAKILEPLFTKANALDLTLTKDSVQFALLSERIESSLELFSEELASKVDGYAEYKAAKEENEKVYSIAVDEYISTTHDLPDGKAGWPLPKEEDGDYGYLFHENLSDYQLSGPGNIQVAGVADFSPFKKIGFFVSWAVSGQIVKVLNDERDVFFAETPTVAGEFQYFEIPTSLLPDKTGLNYTHIASYFDDRSLGAVDGYYISSIVGIGIDETKAQEDVDALIALISSLDENNPDEEAILEAREKYDELLDLYSAEWQEKVTNIDKLIRCEAIVSVKMINRMIVTANSLSLEEEAKIAQFAMLSDRIDSIFDTLDASKAALVEGYETYLAKKDNIVSEAEIAYSGDYRFWDGSKDNYLKEADDAEFGKLYSHVFDRARSGEDSDSIAVYQSNQGQDWTKYKKIGFFARFDKPNPKNDFFVVTPDWAETVYIVPTLVDEATNLYYFSIDLSSLAHSFASDTQIQVYFVEGVEKVDISAMVGFLKMDISGLVQLANELDTTTNAAIAHFTLLSEQIESIYNTLGEERKALVEGYDEYAIKRDGLAARCSILYNQIFTTYDPQNEDQWPIMPVKESSDFGIVHSYDFGRDVNGGINIFFNNAKGDNWAGKKVGIFIQLDEVTSDRTAMIGDDSWSECSWSSPLLYDEAKYIHYYEFDLSSGLTHAFETNPYLYVYLKRAGGDEGNTAYANVSNFVVFND